MRSVGRKVRKIDLVVPRWIESAILSSEPLSEDGKIIIPLVAIVGPPRVGSTLIYQLLVQNYHVFFFDNLQHALLRYPYLAFLLSRELNFKYEGNYKSEFGYVEGFSGLSEGNFFWPYWFDMPIVQKIPSPRNDRLAHIRRVLNRISVITKMPMVAGFNAHGYYLTELAKRFEKVVVINMRRDPLSTAVSILRGRRKFCKSDSEWWSLQPSSNCDLEIKDPYQQIVCQIAGTYSSIKRQRDMNPYLPIVDVEYESLCEDPAVILNKIQRMCNEFSIGLNKKGNSQNLPPLVISGPRQDEKAEVLCFESLLNEINWNALWR